MQEYSSFLERSDFIDCDDPRIRKQSEDLVQGYSDLEEILFRIFHFTRDQILYDAYFPFVQASHVLAGGLGNSVGKACLLAALCRNAGIPAGLIFQQTEDLNEEKHCENNRFAFRAVTALYMGKRWVKLDASHDRWFDLARDLPETSFIKESKLFSDVPRIIQGINIDQTFPSENDKTYTIMRKGHIMAVNVDSQELMEDRACIEQLFNEI